MPSSFYKNHVAYAWHSQLCKAAIAKKCKAATKLGTKVGGFQLPFFSDSWKIHNSLEQNSAAFHMQQDRVTQAATLRLTFHRNLLFFPHSPSLTQRLLQVLPGLGENIQPCHALRKKLFILWMSYPWLGSLAFYATRTLKVRSLNVCKGHLVNRQSL